MRILCREAKTHPPRCAGLAFGRSTCAMGVKSGTPTQTNEPMNQSPWANYHSLNMKHNIKLTPYSDESRTSTLKHSPPRPDNWETMSKNQKKHWKHRSGKARLGPRSSEGSHMGALVGLGSASSTTTGAAPHQPDRQPTPDPDPQTTDPAPEGGGGRSPPPPKPSSP